MKSRPKLPLYLTTPPKGMWYEKSEAPLNPFRARWRRQDGSKDGETFPDAETRADFAEQWVKQRQELGRSARVVDVDTMAAWQEADQISGNVSPIALARFYKQYNGVAGGNLTLSEGLKRFWEIRKNKTVSADTKTHLVLHLGRLEKTHGGTKLRQFEAHLIRTWLDKELRNPDAADGKFAPYTLRHHLKSARILFDTLVRERLLEANPCDAVEAPDVLAKDKVILTPREAFDFFKANRDTPAAGPAAVECFGGLRFTSAARLTIDRIKDEAKGIEMPGSLHKSKKRKYRQGHPHNLWTWIEHAPKTGWNLNVRQYNDEKRAAFVRAGLKPPSVTTPEERQQVDRLRNVFRNSFASYLLALTKNAPLVARLMQHTNTATTEIYEGVAHEADAILFFSITYAATAKTWAQFIQHAKGAKLADLMPGL